MKKNLSFLHCFLNWSPVETGRKLLVKIKDVVLNCLATAGDQIELNYVHNLSPFLMAQGPAHASNMENLRNEVQRVCSGTSDRFVPETSRKSVQADILIAMRRFKNVVRWK